MPASIQDLLTLTVNITSSAAAPGLSFTVPRRGVVLQVRATTTAAAALDVTVRRNGTVLTIFGTGGSGGDTALATNMAVAETEFAAGDTLNVEAGTSAQRGTVSLLFQPLPSPQLNVPLLVP
jgi:ABC-type uncharacterized transport system YnjBCD ATPase subunit